jgi:tRNA1Val (adenine37-N6)-methyltransferase
METDLTLFLNGTLRVHQPRKGYRFNVDSVLLAGFARALEGERVLDLGAGAGILLLLLKAHYHPGAMTGIEIQPEFAELARRNLTENGFDEDGHILGGDLRDPALVSEGSFDLVVANPPFYPSGRVLSSPDPRKAAARDDRTFSLADLAACAARALAPGGRLCFVLPAEREGEALFALVAAGLRPALLRRVRNIPDASDHRVLIQARHAWEGPALELPPLALRVTPTLYSDEVRLLLHQVSPLEPRFFCDAMLGTLARYLRLLGVDAAYARGAEDGWLAEECHRSGRALLTRDRELAKDAGRSGILAFNPDDDLPAAQLHLVRAAFPNLPPDGAGRCLRCNAQPLPLERGSVRGRVPPYTWLTRERFHACPCCGKLTWPGSHLERFMERQGVRSEERGARSKEQGVKGENRSDRDPSLTP